MSAIAQIVCQRCGTWTEEAIPPGRSTVGRCACGGPRQVVRIVHHRHNAPLPDSNQLEQNVRDRSSRETARGHRGRQN
jgi:predicted Rdx family selenoprotein